jgi:uncharacterized protein (TIGR02598 family)
MHESTPPDSADPLFLRQSRLRAQRGGVDGFSLIEVTLAIAIVAFAFISLIGLLPAGMSVFNQTLDDTNEMRISGVLSSMIQATDYDNLTNEFADEVYYFDVDGGALDTKDRQVATYREQRIYSAKVIFDDQYVQPTNLRYQRKSEAQRALILVGKYDDAVNDTLNNTATGEQVLNLLKQPTDRTKIRVFPMVITKTDGEK